jgi:hypothetical protein
MGVTEWIVAGVIVFGAVVTAIWFARAAASYPRDPALASPAALVERDLAHYAPQAKLGWNWGAFFLGPIWYLLNGLWVHAVILAILILLSGGILIPFVMLYGGLKANETRQDAQLARHTLF